MIDEAFFESRRAATGAERELFGLIRQGAADGRAGIPPRSEHPAYGAAYWSEARTRLSLTEGYAVCAQPVKTAGADGLPEIGMALIWGANADAGEAQFMGGSALAGMVRRGVRIINLAGQDLTLYATPLQ